MLGSDVGGISEVIKDGESGYLFQKGNMLDLKRSMIRALDCDNKVIGRNARMTIVNSFSWDNSAKILHKVYEDLACQRN